MFRPQPLDEPWGPRIAAGQVWLLSEDGTLVIERHAGHAHDLQRRAAGGTHMEADKGRALLDHAERMAAVLGRAGDYGCTPTR